MKKFLSFLLSAMLCAGSLFGLTACGDDGEKDNRAVLKVGMECAYQPFNWTQLNKKNGAVPIKGKSGQYANGYDVKIAKKIADALDMRLEIHAYEWDSLIPAVQSGALDFIVAGMSPTDERKQVIDFSDSYYESNLVVVVRKDGDYADADDISDFAGAEIVAQSGTFHDEVIDQISGVNHGQAMDDFTTMIVALKAGAIDGYIAEEPGAIADCNANSQFKYIPLVNNENGFTITDMSNVTLAVGLKKGSSLLAQVNQVLASISTAERLALMQEAISQAASLGL